MQKVNLLFLSFIILSSLVWTSCGDELEEPVVSVSPSTLYIPSAPGNIIEFGVSATSGDAELRNLIIESKTDGSLTIALLDTMLNGESASFTYVFEVPSSQDANMTLTFRIYDVDGDFSAVKRRVTVSGTSLLTESTGHFLYSKYAEDANNAFNIQNLESLSLSSPNLDSSKVDLVNLDSSDDGEMSRSLTSYSGIKFIRNNQFNYPEATQQNAESSFTSSSPTDFISNIQVDDIIIARYDTVNNKYAAIRITNIVDGEGTNGDRFEFNLKK